MFFFKKIIASILLPLPMALIISSLGLYLLWFTKWQRLGKLAMTFSVLIIVLLGSSPVSNFVVSTLENIYPTFDVEKESVSFVMVLGSGHVSDPRLPVTSQLGSTSLSRLIEGVRIYRASPGAKLIFSGYGGSDPVPNAQVGANVALALGVPENDLITEPRAKDTASEARLIKEVIGEQPFALVTSANHLPRAMALFKKQGLNPIPAPAGFLVKTRPNQGYSFSFSGRDLQKSERAIHEYLGITWAKLRGLAD